MQQALVKQLLAQHGGEIIGYKVACTSQAAREMLGVEGPLFGHLLSRLINDNPARLTIRAFATVYLSQKLFKGKHKFMEVLPIEIEWLTNRL